MEKIHTEYQARISDKGKKDSSGNKQKSQFPLMRYSTLFNVAQTDLIDDEQQTFDKIISLIEKIDPLISKHAPERPLTEINQVDLAILRLIIFEAQNTKIPIKVVINEAVELGKEFGTESSPRFVNGILDRIKKEKGE